MYKIKKILILMVTVMLCFCYTACKSENEENSSNNTSASATSRITETQTTISSTTEVKDEEVITETTAKSTSEEQTEGTSDIILNNEYKTKYREVNNVSYPSFTFNYPDNWKVTTEECNPQEELVTLENGTDTSVTFLHLQSKSVGGYSSTYMRRDKITKVAPSQFVPDRAQATDYSFLGEFMVAQIKTIGTLNMKTDTDYTDVDGGVSYAVLPKSNEGTREDVRLPLKGEYTFDYSGIISFTAGDTKEFTPQEQKEVIAILNSFRLA